MTFKRLDVYVCVSDLGRAEEFYTKVFGAEPTRRTPNYTGFDLGGSMFGLFRQDAFPEQYPCVRGNSTTANILVEDIDAEFARIKSLDPMGMTDKIASVGPVRLFHFSDHDMNV